MCLYYIYNKQSFMSRLCIFIFIISAFALASCGSTETKHPEAVNAANPADSLRHAIAQYIQSKNTNIGVAIMSLEESDTLSINGHERYAMMSTCKFPQALALLHLVDEGEIDKNHRIHITPADMKQRTNSTLRKDHPQDEFDLSIQEALTYSIGQSDNVTSNSIFALEGGPAAVEAYVHSLGITEIGIATDYWNMKADSLHKNWITPVAMVALLNKFYTEKILSNTNTAMLWKIMVAAPNGKNRIPGTLPQGTIAGHKTGTSGRDGTTNATYAFNDIGIVQLPNGKHFAIAVFISQSTHSDDDNAKMIADITKMAWDYFTRGLPGTPVAAAWR